VGTAGRASGKQQGIKPTSTFFRNKPVHPEKRSSEIQVERKIKKIVRLGTGGKKQGERKNTDWSSVKERRGKVSRDWAIGGQHRGCLTDGGEPEGCIP